MARKAFTRPARDYSPTYFQYLISEIENFTGLTFNKGERIEANGADETEIVLVSPNGTKYKITVNDAGAVSTTQVVWRFW